MSKNTYHIRSRLVLALSVLVGLVVVSSVATLATTFLARRAIVRARGYEVASRSAAMLSVIAREQYIHEAHTIIVRDRSHVEHHDAWVRKLASELEILRGDVDEEGAKHVDAIARASHALIETFTTSILPAVDRGDWQAVHEGHDVATELVDQMTDHADALSSYFDERAKGAEATATAVTGATTVFAFVAALVACLVALGSARRLWWSLARPLAALEQVAARVASGDRSARVEPVDASELAIVGESFNRMLDALDAAEGKVVAAERLAAIGRVAAGVAHEINNPIAIIRGYLQTMLEEGASVDPSELEILDEEALACQRIAEDLLLYARSPTLSREAVDAKELLETAVGKLEARVRSDVSSITVEAASATLFVDPLRIQQVLQNLVRNAKDATKVDDPVIVRGTIEGSAYVIEVLDRGPGVPESVRERLFEPFFTTRREGTGLGLAVCFGLVAAHGGSIHAEAREGGGTSFVVRLPDAIDCPRDEGPQEADGPRH